MSEAELRERVASLETRVETNTARIVLLDERVQRDVAQVRTDTTTAVADMRRENREAFEKLDQKLDSIVSRVPSRTTIWAAGVSVTVLLGGMAQQVFFT